MLQEQSGSCEEILSLAEGVDLLPVFWAIRSEKFPAAVIENRAANPHIMGKQNQERESRFGPKSTWQGIPLFQGIVIRELGNELGEFRGHCRAVVSAAWICGVRSVSIARIKPETERVRFGRASIHFTVIVQATAQLIVYGWQAENMNLAALSAAEILLMLGIAVLTALLAACIWNKDLLHRLLRGIKVTKQSSYRSAQYSAFAFHSNCYVVLHLKGQRRLFGWPQEWPSRPEDQHFLIEECEWLEGDKRKPITGVSHVLIPAEEVEMIEFLPMATKTETRSDA